MTEEEFKEGARLLLDRPMPELINEDRWEGFQGDICPMLDKPVLEVMTELEKEIPEFVPVERVFTAECAYCGVEMSCTEWRGLKSATHPGGSCPKAPVLSFGGHHLNLEEFRALIRVARAQIDLEKRRGVNQR